MEHSPAIEKILSNINGPELLSKFSWQEWQEIEPPYPETDFSRRNVFSRYDRNGYAWDIHGILYTPEAEIDNSIAVVIFHGGAGSAIAKDITPDGRPGIAPVLASQGFTVLSITYTGHYPPGGIWTIPIAERKPHYLMDQNLSDEEILDRNRKCTFNTIVQGGAQLVDEYLAGRKILAYGHSTGGPMAALLYKFIRKSEVIGILGFGSGGPDGWRKQWLDRYQQPQKEKSVDTISRRSAQTFTDSGYNDSPELVRPWGGAEEFMDEYNPIRSHFKLALRDNQHRGALAKLEEHHQLTNLPREEFFDHLDDPDETWLKSIGVLLLVGENDRSHWQLGETDNDRCEFFIGRKYREYTKRSHVVLVPHYSHYGIMELYNEKIPFIWLWAFKNGYFRKP